MINRLLYKLNKNKFKGAANTDANLNINLESDNKLIPTGEINRIINVGEVFDEERNQSTIYRIIHTISPLFSNVLFNLNGDEGPLDFFTNVNNIDETKSYGFKTFNGKTFRNDAYDEDATELTYLESVNKNLKENNGWFGFYNPDTQKDSLCSFYDLEPTRYRFDLNSSLDKRNWEITITYPYASDNQHYLVNGGLLITSSEIITIGGVDMVALGSPVPHNLTEGDTVTITNMPNSSMNGKFNVVALGFNGDSFETFFVVNMDTTTAITGINFTTGRFKRLYFGNEVTYYLRKFKRVKSLKTQQDLTSRSIECYPLAFGQTIYGDQIYQATFNDDIDVSELRDNLGRPLSQLYFTTIKTDSEGLFTKTISGFDFEDYPGNVGTQTNNDLNVCNIRKMHTLTQNPPFTSHIPLENDIKVTDFDYYGDICEYSKFEAKETILIDIMHRFNTVDRETTTAVPVTNLTINGTRNEGYIYKPHFVIKIREYSNYVEQGDENTVGIPDYAEFLGEGRYLWRDLLPIGTNDGQSEVLDYPFLNGSHYIHQNICFFTRRQDPFGYFKLRYDASLPKDITGSTITQDFQIKQTGYEC
jgi:hypothetical protein